jgi:signal transduction histidine kinase
MPKLCYNSGTMSTGAQIAAYASLIFGYAVALVLGIRYRVGRGRTQRLLAAVLSLALLWLVALAMLALLFEGRWWVWVWYRTAQMGLVLMGLLTADLAQAYVGREGRRWPRWVLAGILSVVAFVVDSWLFSWLGNLSPVAYVVFGPTELATLLLILAWAVPMASASWSAVTALRRARGSKHRNRIRYLEVALLCLMVGDVMVFAGGTAGFALRLLGLSVIAFAVLRHDLPDLKRSSLVALRIVVLAGITAVLYAAFVLIAGLLVGGLGFTTRPQVVVPAIILSVLLAAIIDVALGPRLHRYLDRTVLGRNYDVQRALRAYSHQVSLILDLERLAEVTLDWLRSTLRVERSAFMLLAIQEDGQAELRVFRSREMGVPPDQQFAASSRFIVHFRNIGQPLSQYDLDMLSWFQVIRDEERQWLKALEVDLYIPILVGDKPVALLALGPKGDGQPYSDEDLETLTTLAGQAGTAVENARLVDDLRAVQSDLHRLNTELAETNRQLQRLDQTKSDFVTIASHELRTPLSQIFGYSDVLASLEGEELGDSQVVQQFISGISHGARRLQQVVDAMVDVSLIETGALKLRIAPISIEDVIVRAVGSVAPVARERALNMAVSDLSSLPAIEADAARLEQVFSGLVRNAVKFTPDGSEISISGFAGSPLPGRGGYVEILVADQGIGIDPEQQALIFEKFYRPENPLLHSTNDSAFKGAGPGLGLSIAKGIVEAHGGRIWAESPGRDEAACPGSTFHVRLPLTQPQGE